MSNSLLQRYVLVLLAVVLSVVVLYFTRDLFILLFVSGIFAFLLLPLCRAIERTGAPRWLSALLSCTLMVATVFGLFWFLGWQYSRFGEDLPALQRSINDRFLDLQRYVQQQIHVSRRDQLEWMTKQMNGAADSGGQVAVSIFSFTGAVLAKLVVIPVFTFLLLVLKDKFRTFFQQLSEDHSDTILHLVVKISVLSRKYLKGVLTVIVILAVLNTTGFLILGLKYAVLLGITTALLNIVPYVGVLIGSLLPAAIALLTKDSAMYAVGAIGVCVFTQFLENNFITPKIVGSSVSINPLASIVALLAGGMLWGVAGLILAIPFTGMLKILCDEVPGLKPWGFLIGEERVYAQAERIHIPFIGRKKEVPAKAPTTSVPKPPEP
ncbi:MAG: AI-2E family transporter [Flavobacteriales bacterium]